MGYEWVQAEDGVITIGINDDGLEEFSEVASANLPSEGEEVSGDEVCGELETDQGPMNIYSPVKGKIVEVNEAVMENPNLILEDCYGDGWLIRVEADRQEDVDRLARAGSSDDEDDERESDLQEDEEG
ncbi:MAG: glycine cleavage system protein H [Bdellovibrionales bacterium]|nr:glycine cleavage system protein H [Bdellovibrionales bacterium]